MASQDKFYQNNQRKLIPILKILVKIEEEGILPKSFYKASITLIPKTQGCHKKGILQAK